MYYSLAWLFIQNRRENPRLKSWGDVTYLSFFLGTVGGRRRKRATSGQKADEFTRHRLEARALTRTSPDARRDVAEMFANPVRERSAEQERSAPNDRVAER